MNIKKMLKALRNLIATINISLWQVAMKDCNNFGYNPNPHVEETTIGNLVWHIIILPLIPIAIAINIFTIIIKIASKVAAIKLV